MILTVKMLNFLIYLQKSHNFMKTGANGRSCDYAFSFQPHFSSEQTRLLPRSTI